MSNPTPNELTNASMAFLSYVGQFDPVDSTTVFKIAQSINTLLPTYPNLDNDWVIVWGPALYCTTATTSLPLTPSQKAELTPEQLEGLTINPQANLTFVARSLSNLNSYIVATRGTVANDWWEWESEDLSVALMPWPVPSSQKGKPLISSATFTGLSIMLNTVPPTATPSGYSPLPGAGLSLAAYLANITTKAVSISFTGHSLGGAIAPALALWFKQAQGNVSIPNNAIYYPMPVWDAGGNASISCVSLAGATPGDAVFSQYFGSVIGGNNYDRIYNTNDVVPHGFAGLGSVSSLYPNIPMTKAEQLALKALQSKVLLAEKGGLIPSLLYTTLPSDNPFTCPVNPAHGTFASQALYQHINAYELQFNLPTGGA